MNKIERAKELVNKLDFEGCIEALDHYELSTEIVGLICERMMELDEERFIKFSEEY